MTAAEEFHRAFGLPVASEVDVGSATARARAAVVRVHMSELHGILSGDLSEQDAVEVARACGDLVYVLYSLAVATGIDLDAVCEEIHAANMSQVDQYGRLSAVKTTSGLSASTWTEPDIAAVMSRRTVKEA